MELNKIYNMDCLEGMKLMAEKGIKVDAVITDPPYGTTACKWDEVIPLDEMWEGIRGVRNERTPIVLFGGEPFSSVLRMSNIKEYRYDWVWEKNRGSNFAVVRYQPMKEHENIIVFGEKSPAYFPIKEERKGAGKDRVKYNFTPSNTGKRDVYNGLELSEGKTKKTQESLRFPSSIQKFNTEVGLHPTQKPVALLEYLIKTYTNEGDLVLDFTMGSGTTAIACINTNRNYIGFELDKGYFGIANKRIEEHLSGTS